MSRIVVDTDVASYIFNWHSLARQYADHLRGSELILSFMTIAALRMGAISAGWGNRRRLLLEQFMQRFELVYADNDLCTGTNEKAPRAAAILFVGKAGGPDGTC